MNHHLNLIPLKLRKRQLLIGQFRRWAVACGVAMTMSGLVLNYQQVKLANIRHTVSHIEQQSAELRRVAAENATVRTETQLLKEQVRWLHSLEQSDIPLITLAAIAKSTGTLGGQIQLDRLAFEGLFEPHQSKAQNSTAESGTNPSPVPPPVAVHDRINMSGSAVSDAAISSLLSNLESTGLFSGVDLVGLQAHGQHGRYFQMQCVLRSEADELAAVISLDPAEKANSTAAVTQSGINR